MNRLLIKKIEQEYSNIENHIAEVGFSSLLLSDMLYDLRNLKRKIIYAEITGTLAKGHSQWLLRQSHPLTTLYNEVLIPSMLDGELSIPMLINRAKQHQKVLGHAR